ncbi:MAG TPA: hypothetical protein DCW86_01400 [Actinobacteria bacterium]|nr:hypothetical protein [Actinomycetota bacterium]
MIGINLLPPEICEKRRAEKALFYMIIGVVTLVIILTGIYGYYSWLVGLEERQLVSIQVETQKLSEVVKEYEIYEKKKGELQTRKEIVDKAMAGEVPWHKILNGISMVIPSDVWLISFSGSEDGLTLSGFAIDYAFDKPDFGHKPVAKWMVRLGEVKGIVDIWLTSSSKSEVEGQPAIQFGTTTKLSVDEIAPATAPPAKTTGE